MFMHKLKKVAVCHVHITVVRVVTLRHFMMIFNAADVQCIDESSTLSGRCH